MGNVVSNLNNEYDTGWKDFVFTNEDFENYSTTSWKMQYRRVGKLVELRGGAKNNVATSFGTTAVVLGYLPAGFRPSRLVSKVNNGSSCYRLLTLVYSDGRVAIQRYTMTGTYPNNSAGRILMMFIPFFID